MTNHTHDPKSDAGKHASATPASEDQLNSGFAINSESDSLKQLATGPTAHLTPRVVLQLQRLAGNQAVSKLVQGDTSSLSNVQRVPGERRPRLSDPAVVSAAARGAYVRLAFNMQWTRDEAVEYLWPGGAEPPANFFMPDAADTMGSEENGYQYYLILPDPSVLAGIRPEVHRMIYQSIPVSEGGVELPDMIPQDIQQRIQTELSGEGDMTLSGAWPSPEDPAGLYWVRRRGRRTEVQAVVLPNPEDAPNDRVRDARRTVNHDVAHFVVEDQVSITEARERVRRIHARILRTLIVGYLEAFMIFGGTNPSVGDRFAHEWAADDE